MSNAERDEVRDRDNRERERARARFTSAERATLVSTSSKELQRASTFLQPTQVLWIPLEQTGL